LAIQWQLLAVYQMTRHNDSVRRPNLPVFVIIDFGSFGLQFPTRCPSLVLPLVRIELSEGHEMPERNACAAFSESALDLVTQE
jgi:hypothetical protein